MFKTYDSTNFFDEMIENNVPKRHYAPFYEQLLALTNEQLLTKHNAAQSSFLRQGITFTVYGAEGGRSVRCHLTSFRLLFHMISGL